MDDPVDKIRQKYKNCMANNCNKEGCELSLKNVSAPFVLIDMDNSNTLALIQQDAKRCDYLFIGRKKNKEIIWISPLELTKSNARASKIVSQLRAGACTAEKLLSVEDQGGKKFRFCPIAAYGGGLHIIERNNLRNKQNKIKFNQQSEFVRLIKCGSPLVSVLPSE